VHVDSEQLPLANNPLDYPVYGEHIALADRVDGLTPGQPLALRGKRPRITVQRGALNLNWIAEDGTSRSLSEGDSLLLMAAPVSLSGRANRVQRYLTPQAFGQAIGQRGVRMRLQLQDRDGLVGSVDLRGSDIVLDEQIDDDPEITEIIFLVDTDEAVTHDRDRSYLKLAAATQHCYARNTAGINANVASATHGETVEAILGSGDGSSVNQKFVLNQSPLTFVSASNASGRASSLELRVNDVLWETVTPLRKTTTPSPPFSSATE
jgi:hypothetical protein